jgi:predicted nucleic acid-binding protein
MREIMLQYKDAGFDYVDAAIMAISERLNITRVCMFDRRDFPIFRPKHCPALELLP